MKTVRVEPEAKQELAAAAAWYEERREGLGLELMAEVDAVFAAIARNPSRFPPYPRVAPELGRASRRCSTLSIFDRVHRASQGCSCSGCRSREAATRLLGGTAQGAVRPRVSCEGEDCSRINFPLKPDDACADRQLALGAFSFRVHADD